ncbi:MAG: hypothetical protein JXA94_05075 [Parachlamydiales bacterium]|nr:hypothetical protein [Parachlamydiales bacterium]
MSVNPTKPVVVEPSKWSTLNSVVPNFKNDSFLTTAIKVATLVFTAPIAAMIDLIQRAIAYFKNEEKIETPEVKERTRGEKVRDHLRTAKDWTVEKASIVGKHLYAHKIAYASAPVALAAGYAVYHFRAWQYVPTFGLFDKKVTVAPEEKVTTPVVQPGADTPEAKKAFYCGKWSPFC